MKYLLLILCRLLILGCFLITILVDNEILIRVALITMFLCAQLLIKASIHDFLMLKVIKKRYGLSYWKQPDLIVRSCLSILAFYYSLYVNLRFDIALSLTCFFFFNIWFYRIFKKGASAEDIRAAEMVEKFKKLHIKT